MDHFIYEEDGCVDESLCKTMIEMFEKEPNKEQGMIGSGIDLNIKRSTDLYLGSKTLGDWKPILDKVGNCISHSLFNYTKHIKDNGLDRDYLVESIIKMGSSVLPQIQKTDVGGFYRWHHDAVGNRAFTYIVYLNEVEEGCGGTTDFSNGKCVIPKTGKILIFPANITYLHRGKLLEKGIKYILTGFLYDSQPHHNF